MRFLRWIGCYGLLLASLVGCTDGPTEPSLDDCSLLLPSLAPGEVAALPSDGGEQTLCLEKGGGGSYLATLFVAADPNALAAVEVLLRVEDGLVPLGAAQDQAMSLGLRPASPEPSSPERGDLAIQQEERDAWGMHMAIRERSKRELAPFLGRGPVPLPPPLARTSAPPAVGELVSLSASAVCNVQDARTGRVVAVTNRALVVSDLENPSPSFTDPELSSMGTRFDALVYPTVTGTFGEPTDLDGNGRVILFFTRRVNEQVPPGGVGVAAGFFWNGDLFPRAQCPSSNVGEVLYLAVPDPGGVAGPSVTAEKLRAAAVATTGHELQHLINDGARIHKLNAEVWEETWLDEGLSFMAEELLFFEESGLSTGANLSSQELLAGGVAESAFSEFGVGNVGRFNLYVQIPRFRSPFGADGLETRGATWSFLRYALDRHPGADGATLYNLANTRNAGLANLAAVLGVDPRLWMRDWFLTVYADDEADAGNPLLQQPSWNLRSLIRSLRTDARYPVEVFGMGAGGYSVSLGPGNGAFFLLEADSGPLRVLLSPGGSVGEAGTVWLSLVRIS